MLIGQKLKLLREERGLSLDRVGGYFGKSKQWVDRLERETDETKLSKHIRRYADILNVCSDELPSIEEDGKLVISLDQIENLSIPIPEVKEGEVIRKMITLRNPDPDNPPNKGFLLIPYLLDYRFKTSTKPHTHVPSLEVGVILKGSVELNIAKMDSGKFTNEFESAALGVGDSYSLSSSIPHFTNNISESNSLILVIRLAIRPWSVTKFEERHLTYMPKDFPKRKLIAETNTKSIRMLEGGLGWQPGEPGIPYHRHEWSEEFIYVSEGQLKVKLSPSGTISTPPKVYQLETGTAIHMDGRFLHAIENASDTEEVRYIVVHRLDVDDYGDSFIWWEDETED
jgi:transcriptional regulator with XRE-family HTH domain